MAAIADRQGAQSSFARTIGILLACIALAWIVSAWAELSGAAAQFHHHALFESGRPFWQSALLVLCSWQVMTAAVMLPSSLPFIRMYRAAASNAPDFPRALICGNSISGSRSWARPKSLKKRVVILNASTAS